jgi:hypothetical protein
MRQIEITIDDNGDITVEGINLRPGERIEDVAKFITDNIATVTETGHKHSHSVMETNKIINKS